MNHAKLLGAALAAAFALSAIPAATAAAGQPEFLNSSGLPVSSTTFTGTSGVGTLTGPGTEANKIVILCTGGRSSGHVNSSTTVDQVLVLYSGCKDIASERECHSTNEASGSGIVLTNELDGKLGVTSTGSGVGLLLSPESGTEFVKISSTHCTAVTIAVTGSIIGEVLPGPGHVVLTGELNLSSTGSSQNIQGFSGGANELLKAFGSDVSGLEAGNSITFGEEVEVS